jgi:hypothetical protein
LNVKEKSGAIAIETMSRMDNIDIAAAIYAGILNTLSPYVQDGQHTQ